MGIFNDTPQDYRVLFLDMDSFFASCEQQMQAHLRGRPVGVVPSLVATTCVLSASYEAKDRGVKTGTGVRDAQVRCPDITFIEARPSLYKEIHYKIVDVLNNVTPWVSAKSIDEFALCISPSERTAVATEYLANTIKTELCNAIGPFITASIGFAPNQFLAKVASEYDKPNGLTIITLNNLDQMIGALELTDLPGIARGLSRQLRAERIYTTSDLLAAPAVRLRSIFGFLGEVWWRRLHGYEVDDVEHNRSSIGHSHVLAPAWRMPDKAYQVLQRLVHKAGQRLRREGFLATYTSLGVRHMHDNSPRPAWGGGGYYNFVRTHPYQDSPTAIAIAERLFQARPSHLEPILQLVFTFSGLEPARPRPQSLFAEIERPVRLTEALDVINDKFGRDTIMVSSMLRSQGEAPDRIPFGKLRY